MVLSQYMPIPMDSMLSSNKNNDNKFISYNESSKSNNSNENMIVIRQRVYTPNLLVSLINIK